MRNSLDLYGSGVLRLLWKQGYIWGVKLARIVN